MPGFALDAADADVPALALALAVAATDGEVSKDVYCEMSNDGVTTALPWGPDPARCGVFMLGHLNPKRSRK